MAKNANEEDLRSRYLSALSSVQGTSSQLAAIRKYVEWLEERLERVKAVAREVEKILPTDNEDDCG